MAPYELGMPVLGAGRERFSVKFYMVAMLFIIFDIETVFMIPWAVGFRQLTDMTGLLVVEMFVFVLILAVGYVYVWKRERSNGIDQATRTSHPHGTRPWCRRFRRTASPPLSSA